MSVGLSGRLGGVVLLLASTTVSLAVAEALSRLMGIGDPAVGEWIEEPTYTETYAYVPNSELRYRYPDNPRGYFDEENEVRGTVNRLGFRGEETSRSKPEGVSRVIFLGDSFTLGIGVRDHHTLPARFAEEMVNSSPTVEVLNFGLSGSNTGDQVDLLEDYAVGFSPDLVVLTVFLNDADRFGTVFFLGRPSTLPRLRERSFFLNGLMNLVEDRSDQSELIDHYREGYLDGSPGWAAMQTAIRRAKAIAAERQFELVVAVYPVLFQLNDYPFSGIHETIRAFTEREGIPLVDLLPAFQGWDHEELWVHRTDQHPNEVAHRLAAALLANRLEAMGILPVR